MSKFIYLLKYCCYKFNKFNQARSFSEIIVEINVIYILRIYGLEINDIRITEMDIKKEREGESAKCRSDPVIVENSLYSNLRCVHYFR